MLKRAQRLASFASSKTESDSERKPRSTAFSLKRSPITRLLAWHVGRGQSACMMQQMANAAVKESGAKHVDPSVLPSTGTVLICLNTHREISQISDVCFYPWNTC